MIYRTVLFALVISSLLFAEDTFYNFNGYITSGSDSLSAANVKIYYSGYSLDLLTDAEGRYDGTITVTAINDNTNPPRKFELLGSNYPNPFGASRPLRGKLSTTIPVYAAGNLTVTNVLGQTVFSESINRNLDINTLGLASGIYFACYVSKNNPAQTGVKKMVLLDGGRVTFHIRFNKPKNLPGFQNQEGLSKAAADSARYIISLDGYSTLDTTLLAVEGANNYNFSVNPILRDYLLSGIVTSDGEPVKGALVVANIGSLVDSVYTGFNGDWAAENYESYNDSEDASVEVFKERYEDWASRIFSVTPGETVVNTEIIKNFRELVLKYQDAGTKETINGDSLKVTDATSGEEYFNGLIDSEVSFEIPKSNPDLSLEFNSPEGNYLSLVDTIKTAQVDTAMIEGIQNIEVNDSFWNGFKEYIWHVARPRFDEPKRRFTRFASDSIPVFIPEKVEQDVDWRQTFIDSVVTPLNDLVRTSENPNDCLFITENQTLADNQGILVIYDINNYTEPYRILDNVWCLSNADVYWLTVGGNDENVQKSIDIARHETYLHAFFDGIHSPDGGDNFYGPPNVSPQPHEQYLLKLIRNKTEQNFKGFKDINE